MLGRQLAALQTTKDTKDTKTTKKIFFWFLPRRCIQLISGCVNLATAQYKAPRVQEVFFVSFVLFVAYVAGAANQRPGH